MLEQLPWMSDWPIAYPRQRGLWTVTDTRRWGVLDPETGQATRVDPGADPALPGLRPALELGRLVSYRFERRAVVATPSSYIKVVRPGRVDALATTHAAIASAPGGFEVPPVVSVCGDGRLELGPVKGRSLHDLLRAEADPDLSRVADLVAAFHLMTPLPRLRSPRHDDCCRWARTITRAEPTAGAELAELATMLPRLEPRPELMVHGDLHDKNLIMARDGSALIDLDGVTLGAAEDDVANLAVHLKLRALQAGLDPGVGRRRSRALYHAYDEHHHTLDRARLRAAERHTWFRLACLYRFRRASRPLAASLLGRAVGDERQREGHL
ncbi:MAG: phosphotransferase [Acidimicrobiales bacterium]